MPRPLLAALLALPLAGPATLLAGCNKKPETFKTRLGRFDAEEWREKNSEGNLLHCYLFGKESNNPVRLCGEGSPSPDNQVFLVEAKQPQPGPFTEAGKPLPDGWYILRAAGSEKVDPWALGRLGDHQWLGGGKALLAVDTDDNHTTHVRLLDAVQRIERTFDVPLVKTESYTTVREDDDKALLLVQTVGVELLILVHDPITNPYIEVLDVPEARSLGAKRLWRRGLEDRSQGKPFRFNAGLASNVSWKDQDPQFEGAPLGPFEDPEVRKKKVKQATK